MRALIVAGVLAALLAGCAQTPGQEAATYQRMKQLNQEDRRAPSADFGNDAWAATAGMGTGQAP